MQCGVIQPFPLSSSLPENGNWLFIIIFFIYRFCAWYIVSAGVRSAFHIALLQTNTRESSFTDLRLFLFSFYF